MVRSRSRFRRWGPSRARFSQAAATANPGDLPKLRQHVVQSVERAGQCEWLDDYQRPQRRRHGLGPIHHSVQRQYERHLHLEHRPDESDVPQQVLCAPESPSIQRSGGLQAFDAATTSPVTLQIGATLTETNGSGTVMVQNGGSCVQQLTPVVQQPK